MIFSKTQELEDRIVEFVLTGRISVKSLHERLATEKKLSLRAVYKSVDKLIGAGVLIKVGKRLVMNEEWARGVARRLRTTTTLALSPGELIAYTFTSVEHLDAFWKTTVLPIEESTENRETFFYNPHNFWAYIPGRKDSETAYYKHFLEAKQQGFFVVGGDSEADKEFKRSYQSELLQIDTRNISSLRRTDHITVLGTTVITVRVPKKVAVRIDEIYASGMGIKDISSELVAICQTPGNMRFVIENNPRKAKELRKLLARNFYFLQPK